MDVMIGQSINCIQGFLTERKTDYIAEERKSCMQSMLMQGRDHFMNNSG